MLALLALRTGKVVRRDQLIDTLWGEDPPPTAVKTLHSHIAHLRRALTERGLGGVIETRDPGYRLNVDRLQVDIYRFEAAVATGCAALAQEDAGRAIRSLRTGLELWRGDALADCSQGEWITGEATRLEQTRITATETLLEAEIAVGNHAYASAELECLLARYPLRDRLWGLLMLALFRDGRQAEALRAYERARRALLDVGLHPGTWLRGIHDSVLRDDHTPKLPTVVTVDGVRPLPPPSAGGRLPAPLTSLVGRAPELAELLALAETRRLVTVTGMGGCGKTRLAIAAAERVVGSGRSEVAFADLATVSDPARLPLAVADAVGAREEPDVDWLESVAATVGQRDLLLVLDNCEHLVDDCARVVELLLRSCARLRVLATSRECLGVAGETVVPLRPLPVPDVVEMTSLDDITGFDAVKLFLERARAARGALVVSDRDAPSVARICRSVDGLPLAIELAAARASLLTFEQIAARVADPFGLLAGGCRSGRPQHQALRATVDWSYGLLSPDEQAVLRSLSVFVGGFTLEAAEGVCDGGPDTPVLDLLASLVAKSLVQVEPRPGGARYRLLETIRHYAQEKLVAQPVEADVAFRRHAAFFLELAERMAPRLQGADLEAALTLLECEHDNLREALTWLARRGDGGGELRLAGALARYCYLRGHYREGRGWLEEARRRARQPPSSVLACGLHGEGMLAFYECDYDDAEALCRESMELYRKLDDDHGTARCLTTLGSVARERGDYVSSLALHNESLAVFRRTGDRWGVAHSLQMSGFVAWLQQRFDEATAFSGESLVLFRDLGDNERSAWALLDLGAVAHYRGDHFRARQLLDEALRLFELVGFKEGVAWALNVLGLGAQASGDHSRARMLLVRSARLHGELRDRWRLASVLEALAVSATATGDMVHAAALIKAAAAVRQVIGAPTPPCERPVLEHTRALVRAHLGDQALTDGVTATQAMTIDEVVRMAVAER